MPRPNLDIGQWLQSQLADPVLAEVREWLLQEEIPSKETLRGRPQAYHRYAQVLHELYIGPDRILRYIAGPGQAPTCQVPTDFLAKHYTWICYK
ncbi:MAG: hypothetical protein GY696_02020 [Gammaproteobacteria bacterium]|nr:hypothetical protein [Gammaproteobacteria bacterium]